MYIIIEETLQQNLYFIRQKLQTCHGEGKMKSYTFLGDLGKGYELITAVMYFMTHTVVSASRSLEYKI